MEFRQLTDEAERRTFITRVEQARAQRGGFRENSRYRAANCERLDNSRLFALFVNHGAPAEEMVAGIAMHDLRSFPQSCAVPDLSDFAPQTVLECSDHWSLSTGAGMLAWAGLAVPVRLLGGKAILAYLAAGAGDTDHAGFYAAMGFVHAGPVVEHPFVEGPDGRNLPVQGVLLHGTAFDNAMAALSKACLDYSDDGRVFHLRNFIRPLIRRTVRPAQDAAVSDATRVSASLDPAAQGPAA